MTPLLDIHLSGLDVLVVEDDPISAIVTSRILIMHGARVFSVDVVTSNGLFFFANFASLRDQLLFLGSYFVRVFCDFRGELFFLGSIRTQIHYQGG
jgi:hypothetical protein